MGVFHGIFDFKIYNSPLRNLLRSERFERQFVKYAATVNARADFTKVISFLYLVLCHGWSKGKVKRLLRIKTDSDRKYLDDKVKKHEVKAIEVLHWTKFYEWEPPQNLTQKKQSILDLAISEIDQGKIRSEAQVGKERLREILKELNLNTREKRLFAKVATERNRSNGKNHHK